MCWIMSCSIECQRDSVCLTLCFGGHTLSVGKLDPYSGWDVSESTNPSVEVIVMDDGAVSFDLRHSNPADPQSVIVARKKIRSSITSWIKEK